MYTISNPGTVHPGDVISVSSPDAMSNYRGAYLDATTDTAQAVKEITGTLPYTVEEVAGAIALIFNLN